MNDSEILSRLSELLGDVVGADRLALKRETTAKDVAGWDSLANVKFVLAVQQAFRVRLAAGEVGRLKNVGDLVDLIGRRVTA